MAYGTLSYAIIFLPLALYSVEKYYQSEKTRFLVLLSLCFPLSFFSGHFQISLYFLFFSFFYIIYKFISVRNFKIFVWTLFAFLTGLLLSFPQLIPSIELYGQSLRSGIFQKIEVIPWGYIPTFLAPDIYGNPVTRNDWFGHYAEWNAYVGLVPFILAVYSLFGKKTKEVLFFGALAVFSLLLSFPSPVLDLLILLKIPVLSTSAASRIIVLFSFSMAVLSAFGFEKLINDVKSKSVKVVFIFIFFALVFLSLWALVLLKLFIPMDKIIIAKQNLILPTGLFTIFAGISFIYFGLQKRISKKTYFAVVASILLLVSFDCLRFVNKWMPFDPKALAYPNTPVSDQFSKISGYDRVFGALGGEATTFYKLPAVEGYDALYIKRYGDFVASLDNGKLENSARSVVSFPRNGKYAKEGLSLMGVKYIVHKVSDGHASWAFPFWTSEEKTFDLLYNDNYFQILKNNKAYPRAFLVSKYIVEENPQKIINKMFDKHTDLRKTVILEENPKVSLNGDGLAKISEYKPNRVVINTKQRGDNMLFLSDSYDLGWKAYVDGKETKIYRADYTFRAVVVPEGEHSVEFKYEPLSFKLGIMGALLGIVFLVTATLTKSKLLIFPKLKLLKF
jgi:hypothetical protein